MANSELLREVLEQIECLDERESKRDERDRRWHQGEWRAIDDHCGTAMCFAGWTVELAPQSAVYLVEASDVADDGVSCIYETHVVVLDSHTPGTFGTVGSVLSQMSSDERARVLAGLVRRTGLSRYELYDLAVEGVQLAARRLLGLDIDTADWLFDPVNSLATIRTIVNDLTGDKS